MVVARRSGESAAGPKSESCARRGESGWAVKEKPATAAPGGRASSSRRSEGQKRLDVAGRRGQRDRAGVAAVGIEREHGLEARAREGLRLEAADETLERGVREKEKRLERGERPLELHALGEGGRRDARLERPRIDAARGGVQGAADLAETARDFALGKLREVADRVQSPAVERRGRLEGGSESRERQRREKGRLFAFGDDGRRVGKTRGDARGELGARHADARGQERLLRGDPERARECHTERRHPSPFGRGGRGEGRAAVGSGFFSPSPRPSPGGRGGRNLSIGCPSSSRYTTPPPSSSTRGEKASATSSSASCAARSPARSRPRASSFGRIARACGSVMPGSMPARRARRVAATTRAALPLPSQTTTASSFSSGSLRSRAASGKSGT